MLQRLDTSGSNAPLHPGKVQNPHSLGHTRRSNDRGLPGGEVETSN